MDSPVPEMADAVAKKQGAADNTLLVTSQGPLLPSQIQSLVSNSGEYFPGQTRTLTRTINVTSTARSHIWPDKIVASYWTSAPK